MTFTITSFGVAQMMDCKHSAKYKSCAALLKPIYSNHIISVNLGYHWRAKNIST